MRRRGKLLGCRLLSCWEVKIDSCEGLSRKKMTNAIPAGYENNSDCALPLNGVPFKTY